MIGFYFALGLNEREVYYGVHQLRRDSLAECSRNEYIVNQGRLEFGLPPLPTAAFCNLNPYSIPMPPE